MSKIIKILTILILISCSSKTKNELGYSKEFIDYFNNSEIILSSDSLIFPKEADSMIILIPTELKIEKEYHFIDTIGQELTVKRINYTDIEYIIKNTNTSEKGMASLQPRFWVGSETTEANGEIYSLSYYDIENEHSILTSIGIGIIDTEEEMKPFAYIIPNKDIRLNNLIQGREMLKLKE